VALRDPVFEQHVLATKEILLDQLYVATSRRSKIKQASNASPLTDGDLLVSKALRASQTEPSP
jgi:hypothetical protein